MATCGSGRSWRWRREMDSNGCLQLHFVKENVCHTSGNITKRKMKCTSSSDASQQRVANSNSCYGSNPTALFIFVLAGSQLAVSASSDSNVASAGNVLPTLSQQQQQPELPRPTEATPPAVDRVRRRPAHETVSGPPAATPPSAALMIINGSRGGTQSYNTHRVQQPSEVIQNLLHYYNGQQPPLKDRPTEVKLGVYINTIYSISEQTMDYSVSMYLRQAWRDPRLAFPMMQSKFRQIRLGDDHLAHVWVPDTFFRNEKRATFHDVTVSNRLMRLNATGHIWYVTKISATLSCPMKLNKYPMDTQKCPMMFESFGNTMDILYFSWIDRPVDIERDLQLPQFSLRGYTQHDCSQNYTAGAFPCMEIGFILRRDIGYFLIQQYVPSLLIVILSWVSFWINVDASPARVSIGLLTVLTTTTQSTAGVNSSLPRVSYIKAIDVWMSTCLLFVFAALVEYALVNVLARRHSVRHSVGGGGGAGLMTSFRRQVPGRFPINKSTPAPSSSAAAAVVAAAGPSSRQQRPCLLPGISSLLPDNSGTNQTRFDQQQQQVNRPNSTTVTSDQAATTRPVGSYGNMSRVAMTTGGGPVRSGTCYETCPAAAAYDGKWKARRVDRISRKAFPLAFLLFMLAYWIGYSLPSSADVDDEGEIPISTSD